MLTELKKPSIKKKDYDRFLKRFRDGKYNSNGMIGEAFEKAFGKTVAEAIPNVTAKVALTDEQITHFTNSIKVYVNFN